MAEDKKDSRRAVSFWRRGERERERKMKKEGKAEGASERGQREERVPGLLEPEKRIKEKREKCV